MRRVCWASTRFWSMSRGLANASRMAGSVISEKVTRRVLVARDVGGFGDVPGDRLAFTVEVGGEEDHVRGLGRLGDLGDLLAAVLGDDVLGLEVVVDIHAELALAGVLRQVADVAVGGQDPVVGAEVALDGPGLGRGFDDDEVLGHGRECSTGSCTVPYPAVGRRSGLADAAEEVLVDLEVLVQVRLGRSPSPSGSWACTPTGTGRSRARSVPATDVGRDLDEPDVDHREVEDGRRVIGEDRALAVHVAQVRAAQRHVRRGAAGRTGRPGAAARR